MVLSDGQTNFGIDLESSVFVHENNIWWLEGILKRKKDLSMIETLVKISVLGPLDSEVPSVDVVL